MAFFACCPIARRAHHAALYCNRRIACRPPLSRVDYARMNADRRNPKACRKMLGPAVIADEQHTTGQEKRQFVKLELSNEIVNYQLLRCPK